MTKPHRDRRQGRGAGSRTALLCQCSVWNGDVRTSQVQKMCSTPLRKSLKSLDSNRDGAGGEKGRGGFNFEGVSISLSEWGLEFSGMGTTGHFQEPLLNPLGLHFKQWVESIHA